MAKRKPLVCQHLEHISGTMLEKYQHQISSYVMRRHGVYALYRRDHLYYVGLASNLRNRLKHHLKDKHKGKWDRFSVYLTIGDSHLKELESLVLRIVLPDGNTQRGKFARSQDLKRLLKRDLLAHQRSELDDLLQPAKRTRRAKTSGRIGKPAKRHPLAEHAAKPFRIRVTFKKKRYTAQVKRNGQIRYDGKLYDSPSLAATAVRQKPTNGWRFWQYERAPGDWVRLSELRN
jgi:hypothetical protein